MSNMQNHALQLLITFSHRIWVHEGVSRLERENTVWKRLLLHVELYFEQSCSVDGIEMDRGLLLLRFHHFST
jgi:hypothetical protein